MQPDNVLVSAWPQLTCKLCDFGLARSTSDNAHDTMTKGIGTPAYMAPELLKEEDVAEIKAPDVYAWAITAWAALAFQAPYDDIDSKFQIVMGVTTKNLRPTCSKDWPRPLAELMAAAWHAEASKRPTFVAVVEMLQELDHDGQKEKRFLDFSPFEKTMPVLVARQVTGNVVDGEEVVAVGAFQREYLLNDRNSCNR